MPTKWIDKHSEAHVKSFKITMDKAARIAQRNGEAKVVLSFGSANGGAYFARWLRWQLMQRFGYSQPNNVYLDTVALETMPGTFFKSVDKTMPWVTGIASINEGWKQYYDFAISQCHTMIFVVTEAWSSSPWCQGEFQEYAKVNRTRRMNGQKPIKGMALMVSGSIDAEPSLARHQITDHIVSAGVSDWWQVDGLTLLKIFSMVAGR
ncbi:MAG: toll/interleukin-1 receptor domain-containing protein [Gemmatimonadota bacterium]